MDNRNYPTTSDKSVHLWINWINPTVEYALSVLYGVKLQESIDHTNSPDSDGK